MTEKRADPRRKFHFDESFFGAIDTEAKAYFFGFMAADGWIKHVNGNPAAVVLEIQRPDEEVLVAWQGVMGNQVPEIKHREQGGSKKSRIVFTSAKMARDLVRLGLKRNKTFTLGDITGAVPTKLMRHFVRGVFDGDGSAVCEPPRLRLSFRGTLEFLAALQRVIPVETHITIGNQKWPTLHTNKHSAACRLAYWMYEDTTFFLSRKWNKCKSGFVPRGPKKNSVYRWKPRSG